MTGSLLAMPMLILNMGGEMLYVLDQRLHAQSISAEKAAKGAIAAQLEPVSAGRAPMLRAWRLTDRFPRCGGRRDARGGSHSDE